jgi:hypothetical protein
VKCRYAVRNRSELPHFDPGKKSSELKVFGFLNKHAILCWKTLCSKVSPFNIIAYSVSFSMSSVH